MKAKIEELVRLLKEAKVVEKIAASENPVEEYMKQNAEFLERMCKLLEEFNAEIQSSKDFGYEISPENALEWSMLLIMTGLNECELGINYLDLIKALDNVEGELEQIALNISMFTYLETWSEYEEKELINIFFAE